MRLPAGPPRYEALSWAADDLLREIVGFGAPNDVGPFAGEGIWPTSRTGIARQIWEASLHELGHYIAILAANGNLANWLRPLTIKERSPGKLISRMTDAMSDGNEVDAIAITSVAAYKSGWPIAAMQIVDNACAVGNFRLLDRRAARRMVVGSMHSTRIDWLSTVLSMELRERACRWEGLNRLPPTKADKIRAILSTS